MASELSLLDYLKLKIRHWLGRGPDVNLMSLEESVDGEFEPVAEVVRHKVEPTEVKHQPALLPWRSLIGLGIAILGQLMFEPPATNKLAGVILYFAAGGFIIWALLRGELAQTLVDPVDDTRMPLNVRWIYLLVSLGFTVIAFLAFSGNKFTLINIALWMAAITYFILAFWVPDPTRQSIKQRWHTWQESGYSIRITRELLLALVLVAIVAFFRFYDLTGTPGEMFSDHAEKLLDVSDVLNGQTSIFFPRNTGREALQFYITAAIAIIFNTGLSFMSLKLGTVLIGFLTLPFIFLLGKELGGKWVGWAAFFLAGIAYWANVISRVGLRFPLYPLFVAPTLYFLIRGLRRRCRNDFIWAGIALGIGLHGYSAIRILPFVVVIGVGLYLLHVQSRGNRKEALAGLLILALAAFVLFLPLFRYILSDPEMFGYRAFSRLGTSERQLPGPAILIFLQNLWRAEVMPFLDNGNIWVHSIPYRPALDVISAVLYFIGSLTVLVRYIRNRRWEDVFLLVSVPLLMLPSILSLAFPEENPSLNRTGGAIVPVFILAAIGFEAIIQSIRQRVPGRGGKAFAAGLAIVLGLTAMSSNYDLVFRQYKQQFLSGAWNSSDMGRVIRGFSESVGSPDTAHVVPYPYWVDTRLVGINAGYPLTDYAMWSSSFPDTFQETRAQLFILNPADTDSLTSLQTYYPKGKLTIFDSPREGKDFLIYFVPAQVP